jgi:hypothetical protein
MHTYRRNPPRHLLVGVAAASFYKVPYDREDMSS